MQDDFLTKGALTLNLPDAAATAALASALAPALRRGDAVLLSGPLGAGKTAFARALIQARLGRTEDVPSPTFTLVQTYAAEPEIWHADLYRLSDPEEAVELGLDEGLEAGISLIEWPERLGRLTPRRRMELTFAHAGDARRVEARFIGPNWEAAEAAFRL